MLPGYYGNNYSFTDCTSTGILEDEIYSQILDMINVNGKSTSVDMLKWGRVSLVFQTLNGETTGVWDNTKRDWVILGDEYRAGVRDALRIARKTKTADLVKLPVRAAGE